MSSSVVPPGKMNLIMLFICRNIHKAGGLDRYVLKVKGTPEDNKKAQQIREQFELQHRQR